MSLVGIVVAGGVLAGSPALAASEPKTGPSDTRAEYVDDMLQSCEQAGYSPDDDYLQLYGEHTDTATDGLIRVTGGTVPTPPPDGHLPSGSSYTGVNVEITAAGDAAGVVVDAVVVKASTASNRYTSPYVPHDLDPDQWYIGPMLETGQTPHVADVSHYLVCYHLDDIPIHYNVSTGAILVSKTIIAPEGGTAADMPNSYEATVQCTSSGTHTVTFSGDGGLGTFDTGRRFIGGLTPGETCTLSEADTGGATVAYTPSQDIVVGLNTATVATITNDFSEAAPATGDIELVKEATGAGDDEFTIEYACQGADAPLVGEITLAAGDAESVGPVMADGFCAVIEPTGKLPDGWERTGYDVDGAEQLFFGPSGNPVFSVDEDATVTVTVQNTKQIPADGPSSSGDAAADGASLARTGPDLRWPFAAALALLAIGAGALRFARRT